MIARCIGCGCTDHQACAEGCYWLEVDYEARRGVCSSCPGHIPRFQEAPATKQGAAAPDFEALRARRNQEMERLRQRVADQLGVPLQRARTNFNPNSCYCACGTGGRCEHRWDGPEWRSDDGCCVSSTCSRCGHTAMSHDMRVMP